MEHTVLAALRGRGVTQGTRITAAVSGGADSVALLTVLYRLRSALGFDLTAAHFNHGLRGAEAARDEAFVAEYCRSLGVPLSAGRGDAAKRAESTGESIEQAARALRYAFFDSLDTDIVATAHTADDNAETLLLHLLRGTGPRGLCGIPAVRGRYLRPLLDISRAQIEAYLSENGISHVEDTTNAADDCTRNRIRHHVMPQLMRENPQFLSAVSRTAVLQTEEEAFLSSLAQMAADNCRTQDAYDCRKLRALPQVLLRRVLLGALRDLPLENPAACYVEALQALVFSTDPSAEISLPGGHTAGREYDLLRFDAGEKRSFAPVQLPIPGSVRIPELGLTATCKVTDCSKNCNTSTYKFCVAYDMIAQSLILRPRRTGDALQLPGGTKTLKKLMIDRKIPAWKRELLPVVEQSGRVAAAYMLGVSRDFLPQEGVPMLTVEFHREEP